MPDPFRALLERGEINERQYRGLVRARAWQHCAPRIRAGDRRAGADGHPRSCGSGAQGIARGGGWARLEDRLSAAGVGRSTIGLVVARWSPGRRHSSGYSRAAAVRHPYHRNWVGQDRRGTGGEEQEQAISAVFARQCHASPRHDRDKSRGPQPAHRRVPEPVCAAESCPRSGSAAIGHSSAHRGRHPAHASRVRRSACPAPRV